MEMNTKSYIAKYVHCVFISRKRHSAQNNLCLQANERLRSAHEPFCLSCFIQIFVMQITKKEMEEKKNKEKVYESGVRS